jgi:dTDP-4-amino-4,6-dideoxy-D-galactose acyltransferase
MTIAIASGRRLDWDSEFFGVPVGQGRAETPAEVEAIDAWAEREAIRCLYLLVPAGRFATTQTAEARGFVLAGIRVTCSRHVGSEPPPTVSCDGVTIRSVRPADVRVLEQIAAKSHGDTRFYADPNFPRASCNRLYQAWIRRSCEGWADHVLTAERHDRLHGYISLHLRADREGVIGLFAVASDARGSGIGRALVDAALRWFFDQEVVQVSVATQAQNLTALRLYQRAGFLVSDVDLWLHKWR